MRQQEAIIPRTSLCSYTYNDAALLHGLLASVPAWSVRPDEIVLLDDGSDEPFALTEAEKALPVRIIRHERNMRFTRAKHNCISAASGEIILAIDCDARVTNDFLELCISALRDKEIGLLAPQAAPPVTDDYTSWYAYAFSFGKGLGPQDDSEFAAVKRKPEKGASVSAVELGDTDFISGNVFALRREVWEKVGGFSAYAKEVHEDSYLSNAVLGLGCKLKVAAKPFRLLRVFSREVLCRRYWKLGLGGGCVEAVPRSGKSLPAAQDGFIQAVLSRCASIEANGLTPVFYYYEILIMCHTLLEFCNIFGPQDKLPQDAGLSLLDGIRKRLAACPRLWLLLKADLLKLRILPLPEYLAPAAGDQSALAAECDWSQALAVLDYLDGKNILDYLEKEGVELVLRDDREAAPDFSGY